MRLYYTKKKIKSPKRDIYLIERKFVTIRMSNRMFEKFHVDYHGSYAKGFTVFFVEIGLGRIFQPE